MHNMGNTTQPPLRAVALVCTLRPSPSESSSDLLARQVVEALSQQNVETTTIRIADHNIATGVAIDMGDGDEWPEIRKQIIDADILLIATPIWMGHTSSVAQKVMERLDAELSETDNQGRLLTYGKVGIVAVVGNEDGAHHVTAELYQALSDVGFTIPAAGSTYWVGEAMHTTDYKDLEDTPDKTAQTNQSVAVNAAHLARLLAANQYPPVSN